MKSRILMILIPCAVLLGGASKKIVTESAVASAVASETQVERLKEMGPGVLPHLAKIYTRSDEEQRATIAWLFYSLGWKSGEAKAVLMKDVRTSNERLRLQVQWALGRVSDDADVVEALADIMQHDTSPLFRDKAACALAYDQIHLSEEQKVRVFAKLIKALRDPKPQVRSIAIKALQIHTGQTKSFRVNGDAENREKAVLAWEAWLQEYAANL